MTTEFAKEIGEKKEVTKLMSKILSIPFPKGKNLVYTIESPDDEPADVLKFMNNLQFLLAFRKFGESDSSVAMWREPFSAKFRQKFNETLTKDPDFFGMSSIIGDIAEHKLVELESAIYE